VIRRNWPYRYATPLGTVIHRSDALELRLDQWGVRDVSFIGGCKTAFEVKEQIHRREARPALPSSALQVLVLRQ
jgi:hypothetical protein